MHVRVREADSGNHRNDATFYWFVFTFFFILNYWKCQHLSYWGNGELISLLKNKVKFDPHYFSNALLLVYFYLVTSISKFVTTWLLLNKY
jgi:hypothetical protein